jgi:hypothetical protein
MITDKTNPISILIILSLTLIGIITLARNTNMKVDIKFGTDRSIAIEGERLASPAPSASFSLPGKTKVDCLPIEENSQLLNR